MKIIDESLLNEVCKEARVNPRLRRELYPAEG